MPRDAALAYWMGPDKQTLVAVDADGQVVGTYYCRANQAGGGAHIANCGYVVAAHAGGRGIARAMAEDSFARARGLGFTAMQFNFVVASNTGAVALWQKLGFAIVGRVPGAFDHPALGPVDALVMHRTL
jgi:ribosomal protein S18 acetylase RimI-like enzyme